MVISSDKTVFFRQTRQQLECQGFRIEHEDPARPWGGFFVLDETQAQQFANQYFDGLSVDELRISGQLSPKILLVAPGQRLSWQYHYRRAEIWRVVSGPVGIITSDTDQQGELQFCSSGEQITLRQGERHRLIGLDDWGVIAEIWQHTDATHPSDEDDIVRVQDDFNR
ncbi:cupin domain-containing protein [Hymenobacter actinosclerus]|uniref:Mannose-6-phosphate isomerase, type 2 n=1 Tax=Hymenobacter actinosclerus TaxID=82805 RepID=A0A1I0BQM6_9BACT|nr:phosphoheptose isomerase [Hymenobacter actinosclerus]SET08994.1 mannose-6-phosphate isomerase, type 2 [Hymenobacter actinosclerus]